MIAAVILAAGGSTRFGGRPKQLLAWRGRPLIRVVADAALEAGCRPVIVVLGAHAEAVGAGIEGLPVEIVSHTGWAEGVGSSIRAGFRRLLAAPPEVQGALVLTCDQPRISAAVIGRLIGAFDGAAGGRVACEYSGTVGVPALFERSLFGDLTALGGDRGARSVLLRDPDRLVRVPWPEGAENLNTPEDYRAGGECEPPDGCV